MIPGYRTKFNSAFTYQKYQHLQEQVTKGFPPLLFRIAETPIFLPAALSKKLSEAGDEMLRQMSRPDFKVLTQAAIPEQWNVPGENDHPHFLAFDFAICKDEHGELTPKLIEMQGFPSLFGFQMQLAESYIHTYGLKDLGDFTPYFNGLDKATYVALLKKVIVGDHHPEEVALLDLEAPQQKTAIDFSITQRELGIVILSTTDLIQEGQQLFYKRGVEKIRLKRIYNRLIFDEVKHPEEAFQNGFDPRQALDIEWITHPNWFYRISKYTMPFLKGDFIPESHFLNELQEVPEDLDNYVLKPLFSFAGQGVIIDVTKEDLQVKDPENWILQRKVRYEPVVQALDGGVKAEIRMMYLWPDNETPQLCINLARLSRGKMIGVRYNQDFDWVGGSVALIEK